MTRTYRDVLLTALGLGALIASCTSTTVNTEPSEDECKNGHWQSGDDMPVCVPNATGGGTTGNPMAGSGGTTLPCLDLGGPGCAGMGMGASGGVGAAPSGGGVGAAPSGGGVGGAPSGGGVGAAPSGGGGGAGPSGGTGAEPTGGTGAGPTGGAGGMPGAT